MSDKKQSKVETTCHAKYQKEVAGENRVDVEAAVEAASDRTCERSCRVCITCSARLSTIYPVPQRAQPRVSDFGIFGKSLVQLGS